ncbi:MAG: alpha/beta hydrolase [Pseudomonadota bacterium]
MELQAAPFFQEVAPGPLRGAAHWVTTSDDVRIRVGHWLPQTSNGTVLLFPGRTEFIEKYSETAGALAARGYATLAIDWRGQGLADRLHENRELGHIGHFPDYQKDVAAALRIARALELPRPWHLLAHSMGGAIGLRAAIEGLPVQSCAYSGPMWGIYMSPIMRPIGWAIACAGPAIGLGAMLPPSTKSTTYVLAEPFEGNTLTTDPAMYKMMQDQAKAHPELVIGGPSLIWLREALTECKHLVERPSPDMPCLCFMGGDEAIVDTQRVHERMESWPRGQLDVIDGARHEVLMEAPAIRNHVMDRLAAFCSGARDLSRSA